jgi:hypothetical protein
VRMAHERPRRSGDRAKFQSGLAWRLRSIAASTALAKGE